MSSHSSTEARLFGMSYSPWTEKARWALDHHQLAYAFVEHTPLIDELSLRVRARKLRGAISVPTLLAEREVVMGSLAIARWADARATSEALEQPSDRAAVDRWDAHSERACQAGRALVSLRMRTTPGALEEAVPAFIPSLLRKTVGQIGVRFIARKYTVDLRAEAAHEAALAETLGAVRAGLATGAGQYLLGDRFTLADIVAACAVNVVVPVGAQYVPIGPRTREAWTRNTVAQQYADIIAWRDALYTRHRRGGAA